jgi:hypothetical protein
MEVPQGRYRLVAGKLVKNRYRYWDGRSALPGADSFPVPEAGSDPSRFRIELAPLGNAPVAVLSGRVFAFDPRSSRPPRPLTGARVEAIPLLPSQNASAAPIREETDEDGTFVIEVPPDTPYLLRAEAEGFEPRFHRQARRREDGAWIDVEPGGRRPRLDVTLMPRTREDAAAAVEGSVLRRLSEQECAERKRATCLAPVAGVEVRMAPAFPTAAPVVHRTRTGTDGRFRFEGLLSGPAPGGDYYLSVVPGNDEPVYYPEGVPFAHALPLRTLPGKTVDAGRILAAESPPAAGWLEGTVTDEEKRPLEGALVRVRGPGAETARTARTGQDGAFVVRGLPEGEPVRISAEADGYVPGYYPGVYRWTAAEPVIVPDAGSPTSPVHLTLRPSGSAGALLQSGRVLTGASPEASPMDDAMDTPEDPAGRPLRGAFLYAFNAGGPVSSVPVAGAVSAENGAAILTGLAEGTYFLMADCPGFEAAYFTRESPDHPSPVLLRKGDPGAGAEIRLAPASAGGDPRPDAEPVLVTRAANVPNPFHPQTAIRYRLAGPARVTVHVFDYRGRLVRTLVGGEEQQAGPQQVFWDGRDDGGHRASSGVYFYRILAGTGTVARKMVLLP